MMPFQRWTHEGSSHKHLIGVFRGDQLHLLVTNFMFHHSNATWDTLVDTAIALEIDCAAKLLVCVDVATRLPSV